jgi:hypothetical protein
MKVKRLPLEGIDVGSKKKDESRKNLGDGEASPRAALRPKDA